VQYPQDLLPVVPQSELSPPLEDRHVQVLLQVLGHALKSEVDDVAQALINEVDREFVMLWPGEHYRLLAGFVAALRPTIAIEVGTWQGAAAAILSRDCERVLTFDVVAVDRIDGSIPNFFERYPNVSQVVGNLMDYAMWSEHLESFARADLIFVDGPKDGVFEPAVVPRILDVMKPGSIMILDDIRFAGMQDLWKNQISYPRIDLGSFGHFSGTGVVFR
jgi:predicted O-methyltransferase YrrM